MARVEIFQGPVAIQSQVTTGAVVFITSCERRTDILIPPNETLNPAPVRLNIFAAPAVGHLRN